MTSPILKDFPDSLETPRLLLRAPVPGDGEEFYAAVNESREELTPWLAWVDNHRTAADSEESVRQARVRFLARSELRFHLFLKGTSPLIGVAGLQHMDWSVPKFEIGYWCRSSFVGCGYVTEAVRGLTTFAFETLGARRVEIRCDPQNRRSVEVAKRAGFGMEGKLRNEQVAPDGSVRDTTIFALTPDERSG